MDSSPVDSSQPRKRRRSRKGLEKIFACDAEGCDKKFTRSEHLARHQLNHKPKQIFDCSWPGCDKSFVREDLKIRHLERHRRRVVPDDVDSPDMFRPSTDDTMPSTGAHADLPSLNPEINMDITTEMGAEMTGNDTTDLINWLFSDGMLSNSRDLFLPSLYDTPVDLPSLHTPPTPVTHTLSESKRLDILGLIPSLESHPEFELDCLHRYISLYWEKFHFQFPLLHRPSFEADTTPGVLLLSMILIGAHYGGSHDLALKIAEPLRWVIFTSPGFHPPSKIWIIQSLLILEVFEKTMSSRRLHERAHVHHGTTLQLIRRGTTLIGVPLATSETGTAEIWKRWVDAEMAKRAAFMAFILDVIHASLFAHSSVLSTHEIRLTLPCDEESWDTVPADRTELLRRPTIPFLKALKKLLNQESVTTGRFGSIVLLSGLMSLSYQMDQLDLQISSLGWGAFRDTWRSTLNPAIEFWRADYMRRLTSPNSEADRVDRAVPPMLYLAHVAMWVAIHDLQIFCGVHRVLGRPTRHTDYVLARRRMHDWAISERAREAAFHAYRFLYDVFVARACYPYSASTDVFIHRPGIISHCAQVVWCYGFCLHGPESTILAERDAVNGKPASGEQAEEEERQIPAAEDGRVFLERMCRAQTSRELDVLEGKNKTVGLMRLVIDGLKTSKWDLMKEGKELLAGNIQRSLGREDFNVNGGRVYFDD